MHNRRYRNPIRMGRKNGHGRMQIIDKRLWSLTVEELTAHATVRVKMHTCFVKHSRQSPASLHRGNCALRQGNCTLSTTAIRAMAMYARLLEKRLRTTPLPPQNRLPSTTWTRCVQDSVSGHKHGPDILREFSALADRLYLLLTQPVLVFGSYACCFGFGSFAMHLGKRAEAPVVVFIIRTTGCWPL